MLTRERDIEKFLVAEVKKIGGTAYKFTSPNRRSVPDRIVVLPGRRVEFVELKATGQKPTDAQRREHERLRLFGFDVWVIDTKEGVREFIEVIIDGCPFVYGPDENAPDTDNHPVIGVCTHCGGEAHTQDHAGKKSCFPCAYNEANWLEDNDDE